MTSHHRDKISPARDVNEPHSQSSKGHLDRAHSSNILDAGPARSHSPHPIAPPAKVGTLRLQIVGASNLIGKDRNGKSDPFFVVNLPGAPPKDRNFYRRTTSVQHKTLEPRWNDAEATFDWDITTEWLAGSSITSSTDNSRSNSTDPNEVEGDGVRAVDHATGSASDTPASLAVPPPPRRPSNVRKISAATGKLLYAPVRMSAKGAMATGRVVRRGGRRQSSTNAAGTRPRPMRLRRGHHNAKPPAGSAELSAHGTSPAVSAIELVCWDKDKWSGNDYMGECSIIVADWIPEGKTADWSSVEAMTVALGSSRRHAKVSGDVKVKIGIIATGEASADDLYVRLLDASLQSGATGIRSIPADQSVGTAGPTEAFMDDGLSSGSESEAREELLSDDDDDDDRSVTSDEGDTATSTDVDEPFEVSQRRSGIDGVPPALAIDEHTAHDDEAQIESDAHPGTEQAQLQQRRRRRLFPNRLRKGHSAVGREKLTGAPDGTGTPGTPGSELHSEVVSDAGEEGVATAPKARRKYGVRRRRRQGTGSKSERKEARREARRQRQDYAFKAAQGLDIIGIVQLEVKEAKDLPRWKNSLGTGFDMDPFVIVSFGQRVFRTRVIRHTLNPTWDEKLLFHVRRHEANFVTKLAIYDWDKLSSNDFVGHTDLPIADLVERAPKADPKTGLYTTEQDAMHTFVLPLGREEGSGSSKSFLGHSPTLTVQARYTPYAALRQSFWRQLLRQYDSNDSGALSILELSVMLDSLGSTLTQQTIDGFFKQYGKDPDVGEELTIDEACMALEQEIVKPMSQKRFVDKADAMSGMDAQTPGLDSSLKGDYLSLPSSNDCVGPHAPAGDANAEAVVPTHQSDAPSSKGSFARKVDRDASTVSMTSTNSGESTEVEQVIMLKSCPMCRMPRLSKKAEVDIVTHLAVCASQDWRRVDSMMVSNYVTAMQAHRKWVTKIMTKISQGQYSLGANSANIIVQDRTTGELLEEKMQVYVRLGIRLLYKGARSRMEGARIKRMLKNMSVKQGAKFDAPQSAREIPHFIAFHGLNTDEILDPIDSFKTFNEFFYRKLKKDARPVAGDVSTLVSGADCRLTAFSSVNNATRIWIKGREFSIERLLGGGAKLEGGLVIFRLAPQDYHRFHCPADATIGKITHIDGQYYTVNPMAIRSAIDVYCENVRCVVPFHSQEFGTFYVVCIGAMMVGSICLSVEEGQTVKRGDELGYFKFGGSTIVIVFEQGKVTFDDDLLDNSERAIETLVRVGMQIGRASSAAVGSVDQDHGVSA